MNGARGWAWWPLGLVALLVLAKVAWSQMEARNYPVTVTEVNQAITITIPAKRLTVNNLLGTTTVFVNVSGTGVAAITGEKNVMVLAGSALDLMAGSGENITLVGIISDMPGPSTVYLQVTR